MNASEDGAEPLGEAPDVPARSGVAAVLDAADRVTAAVQACTEIRALHRPYRYSLVNLWCTCGCQHYPCPTVRILDERGC